MMVVLSHDSQQINVGSSGLALIKTCKPVDLSDGGAKRRIVEACTELGFFKVINHGIPMEVLLKLEREAVKFFKLPRQEKEIAGPPNPFGYGSKTIGRNGDVGWIEYLLLSTDPNAVVPQSLRGVAKEYVSVVREMACSVLEMIAEELELGARDSLSRLIRDEKSDSCFRLNHYPDQLRAAASGRTLIGFGEHNPQIISVLRSNNAAGLQVCSRDGAWLSVPPDLTAFFVNVGDLLQVMTNGRFRSVNHRVVLADCTFKSRLSMIYFGAPPPTEKITLTALSAVMEQGEESLYKEFTWFHYKSRLGDNRLSFFLNSAAAAAAASTSTFAVAAPP